VVPGNNAAPAAQGKSIFP